VIFGRDYFIDLHVDLNDVSVGDDVSVDLDDINVYVVFTDEIGQKNRIQLNEASLS
jgi:hypothetical protein